MKNLEMGTGTRKGILQEACYFGKYDLLINEHSKGINLKDAEFESLIFLTVYNFKHGIRQSKEVLEYLLSNGASLHVKNEKGETPLVLACRLGSSICADILIKHGALKTSSGGLNFEALLLAEKVGVAKIEKVLQEFHLDINGQDENGKTLLIFAVEKLDLKFAEHILSLGADVNYVDRKGHNALQATLATSVRINEDQRSYYQRLYDMTALLITHKILMNTTVGEPPLIKASTRRLDNIVELMLINGANPNIRNKKGATPLIAIASEKVFKDDSLSLLLRQSGADPALCNLRGQTAEQIISFNSLKRRLVNALKTNNYSELSHILIESGFRTAKKLVNLKFSKYKKELRKEIIMPIRIKAVPGATLIVTPNNLLMYAVLKNDVSLLELIYKWVSVKTISKDPMPLFYATLFAFNQQNFDLILVLLDKLHVNPNVKDAKGLNAFHYMTLQLPWNEENMIFFRKILKLFLDKGFKMEVEFFIRKIIFSLGGDDYFQFPILYQEMFKATIQASQSSLTEIDKEAATAKPITKFQKRLWFWEMANGHAQKPPKPSLSFEEEKIKRIFQR